MTFYPEIDGVESLERRVRFEADIVGDLAARAPVGRMPGSI